MRYFAATILALSLSSTSLAAEQSSEVQQSATREGQKITLHPTGITLRLPSQWLQWFDKFHNNIHLTRDQLEKIENGDGEWDTEYAKVVNAALPFTDCVAHVGGEGWGREGASFGDIQLRIYLTDFKEQEVLARIHGAALQTARTVARPLPNLPAGLAPDTSLKDAKESQWGESVIQYPLWYGDYGGVAHVRFYMSTVGGETLVLVFMGGENGQVQDIVRSVSVPTRK